MRKPFAVLVLSFVTIAFSATLFAGSKKKSSSIEIVNKSKWDIHHLYLAPSDDDNWGPDQLGKHIIESGDRFTLTDIECDVYDIKLVDEDGDECVIEEEALCNDEAIWKITDEELLNCEGFGD